MTTKMWNDLKEYLEFQQATCDANTKMYQQDAVSGDPVFRNHDVSIACSKSNWATLNVILKKMERLEKETPSTSGCNLQGVNLDSAPHSDGPD